MADTEQDNNISWSASEFIDHPRGAAWYGLLFVGTAGLTAFVYFFSKDYFAMAVIIILGIIVASVGKWKPKQVEYRLTDKGFHVGEKFYPYNQFKYFSIMHENELSSVIFEQTKRYLPAISAFIDAEDEPVIAELVGAHLPLRQGRPDRVDMISRRLRF